MSAQTNQDAFDDSEHQANDKPHVDWTAYHENSETLKMNRSKDHEKLSNRDDRHQPA